MDIDQLHNDRSIALSDPTQSGTYGLCGMDQMEMDFLESLKLTALTYRLLNLVDSTCYLGIDID